MVVSCDRVYEKDMGCRRHSSSISCSLERHVALRDLVC